MYTKEVIYGGIVTSTAHDVIRDAKLYVESENFLFINCVLINCKIYTEKIPTTITPVNTIFVDTYFDDMVFVEAKLCPSIPNIYCNPYNIPEKCIYDISTYLAKKEYKVTDKLYWLEYLIDIDRFTYLKFWRTNYNEEEGNILLQLPVDFQSYLSYFTLGKVLKDMYNIKTAVAGNTFYVITPLENYILRRPDCLANKS